MGKIMADLGIRLSAQVGELIKGLDQANKSMSGFKSNMDNMGKQLIQRFFGIEMAMQALRGAFNFSKESLKMAADAEGIYKAFNKFSNQTFLTQLKAATRGIFNSKELAEYAVRANNLGIKMQDLAVLSKYALSFSLRSGKPAIEVLDNAILAVGRGASKGLVQIGLATEAFDMAYAKVGNKSQAIIDIMKYDLEKYGDVVDTTATKLSQMGATLGDLKLAWGNFLANSEGVKTIFGQLVVWMEKLSDPRLSFWEKFNGSNNEYAQFLKDMAWIKDLANDEIIFNIELYSGGTKLGTKVKGSNYLMLDELRKEALARGIGVAGGHGGGDRKPKEIETLDTLNTELLVLTNTFKGLDITKTKELQTTANQILAKKEEIKVIEDLIAVKKVDNTLSNVRYKDTEIFDRTGSFGLKMRKAIEPESILPKFFGIPSGVTAAFVEKEYGIVMSAYEAIATKVFETMKGSPIELIGEKIKEEATQLGADLKNMTQMLQDGMTNILTTFAEGIGRLAGGLSDVNLGEGLMNALSQLLIQLGSYMIRISPFITAIKYALSTLSGGMLLVSGMGLVAIGGAVAGMASRMSNARTPPRLASGGLAYGSTFAQVGEYAGAKSNPEVIAPLSKLQNILSKSQMGGTVVFEIQGDKLVGVLNNASRLQKSYR